MAVGTCLYTSDYVSTMQLPNHQMLSQSGSQKLVLRCALPYTSKPAVRLVDSTSPVGSGESEGVSTSQLEQAASISVKVALRQQPILKPSLSDRLWHTPLFSYARHVRVLCRALVFFEYQSHCRRD